MFFILRGAMKNHQTSNVARICDVRPYRESFTMKSYQTIFAEPGMPPGEGQPPGINRAS
jgi:hypothetical protein